MKKSLVLFFIIIIFGCTSDKNNISIDLMLSKKHKYFKERYNNNIYKDFWNNIIRLDNSINDLLGKDKIYKKDIDDFQFKLSNIYSYNEIDFESLKNNINNQLHLKNDLKLVQYSLYSYYESLIFIDKYSFDMVRPIVSKKSDKIKLGETYKCEVYLAAANEDYNPIVIINNDTLKYNDKGVPYYEIEPRRRGKYSFQGKMLSIDYNSEYSTFDFIIDFVVE